jgi:YidC/Oxa1 family membrane protein insertase
MSWIFEKILYQPLLNALVGFYNLFGGRDFGLAVIALTIIVRVILSPLLHASLRQQKIMSGMQAELKRVQGKYKDDKTKQLAAVQELYKQNKINPFSSFLLLLVQLPILLALYRVLLDGLNGGAGDGLYSFITAPTHINYSFLGLVDLKAPSLWLIFAAGLAQYWQARVSSTASPATATFLLMPLITVVFLWKIPSAIALYWTVSTIISIIQQTRIKLPKDEKIKGRN